MQYPTLTIDEGKVVLEGLRANRAPQAPSPRWVGRGPRFDVGLVDELVEVVRHVRQAHGEPTEGDKRYWARLEGVAAAAVHETLEDLPAFVAADPGFWIWLVFGSGHEGFVKLVAWRHGGGDHEVTRDQNYGLTTSLEGGFWSRLWLRGDIGFDASRSDPYELTLRGDQDIWRSHVMRQEYAHARYVARALLSFQYPDAAPERPRVPVKTLREMAKELKRRQATMAFELLDDAGAARLIEDVHASVEKR